MQSRSAESTFTVSKVTEVGRFVLRGWSTLKREKDQYIESDTIVELDKTQWRLRVYPRGDNTALGGYVSVYVVCVECDGEARGAWSFRLLDHANKEHSTMNFNDTFKRGRCWGLPNAFASSATDAVAGSSPEDVVVIELAITIVHESKRARTLTPSEGRDKVVLSGPDRLSMDWGALWGTRAHSDITLNAAGIELRLHRLVLRTRSPVFERMLAMSSEMVESATGVIKIEEFDAGTMELLCRYMYTGTLDDSSDVWADHTAAGALLLAAAKYEVAGLVRLAEEQIAANIVVENVAEWLILCSQLSTQVPLLRAMCLEVVKQSLGAVQSTAGWKRLLQNTAVTAEILPLILQAVVPA